MLSDKTTGQKRSRVEIVVEDFNFTGAARDNNNSGNFSTSDASEDSGASAEIPDDIPDGEIDLSDVPF